ncbi:MAG: hypothetical protein A3G34_13480 [Candidatus Lindowbacteria bacterium RIFCSPLOWO2_12_FULL_62_27]|nr:MAG: hypothetical protein A3I06_10970 [Candidatus Lindowbacteria bacterium RIFCSPLOWO2_02_FULL_62_12]OGH62594.1 MAG: hypothetical protein A3G34_13480 [Candidatus Lindowbacteria bacterium RIFCSPLOWO2_12_FULL_62_27]
MNRFFKKDSFPLWLGALFAFACILYFDTFSHEFSYDDFHAVAENQKIHDPDNLKALISPRDYFPVSSETTYRPMVTLVYFLEAFFFGVNPFGYHAVNIFLHACCGLGLAWVGRKLGLSDLRAILAGALFLAHPAAAEAVNAVGFLEDILALFFLLLSMSVGLSDRRPRGIQSLACSAAYLVALLSKEVAILFPVALVILVREKGWDRRSLILLALSMGSALALYLSLRFFIFRPPIEPVLQPLRLPFKETLFTMSAVMLNYIRLFFVPVGLSVAHAVEIRSHLSVRTILTILTLAGFFILFLKSRVSLVRWGGLWCLLFILPVAQIVPVSHFSSERFLYVPLAGACGALVFAWDAQFSGPGFLNRRIPWVMVLILAGLTLLRNPAWRTHESLFEDALRKNPRNMIAFNYLASAALRKERYELAEVYVLRALELKPECFPCLVNLAHIYNATGRQVEANELMEDLAKRGPR